MRHSVLDRQSMFRVSASLALLLCASQGRAESDTDHSLPSLVETGEGNVPGTASVIAPIAPGTPWHLQLTGSLQEKSWAQVYDLDLFDTPASKIQSLVSRGKKVHCYFSAGSAENWRPDYSKYPKSVLSKDMDGWAGEKWVDVRASGLRTVLAARMDLAKSKGCTGIDPDNVDGYGHDTGFPLTKDHSIAFVNWLASEAHARGLSVGLKNGIEILPQVGAQIDFAINEQCVEYKECSAYKSFLLSGKPVFHVEYSGSLSSICAVTKPLKISTLKAPLSLNGPSDKCP